MAVKSNLLNMALCLTAVCLVCAALLGGVYVLTWQPIQDASAKALKASIAIVLPQGGEISEANISELKDMEYDYSYLDERQAQAIRRLAGYALDHRPQGGARDVKGEFVTMWSMLYRLYTGFRSALEANGEAYEGQIYRALADRLESESISDLLAQALPQVSGYVFVGLNALNECERKVLRKMHSAGLAQFSWDYAGPVIRAKGNGSTHFMERNLADFPGSFVPSPEGVAKPEVMVCGIPSATGQAKLLPELLAEVPEDQRGLDFAVVLGDETMLMSVLNSMPVCPEGINVTMGYPLASSELAALMTDVMDLQLHLRNKDGQFVILELHAGQEAQHFLRLASAKLLPELVHVVGVDRRGGLEDARHHLCLSQQDFPFLKNYPLRETQPLRNPAENPLSPLPEHPQLPHCIPAQHQPAKPVRPQTAHLPADNRKQARQAAGCKRPHRRPQKQEETFLKVRFPL